MSCTYVDVHDSETSLIIHAPQTKLLRGQEQVNLINFFIIILNFKDIIMHVNSINMLCMQTIHFRVY